MAADRLDEYPYLPALLSGAAGALALTGVHQLAQRYIPNAPRMDIVGMRAIARGLLGMGVEPPQGDRLYQTTLVGDLLSNTIYYSSVACGRGSAIECGVGLGVGAGVGALVLPRMMGLGDPPHSTDWANRVMTIAWYTLGGLVAGMAYHALKGSRS